MGTIRGKIRRKDEGPIITCEISVSSKLAAVLLNTNQDVPDAIGCKALIDTGATSTIIKTGLGAKLNIPQVGRSKIIGASDTKASYYPILPINIRFETGDSFDITAVEMPIAFGFGIQCLIGRDLLGKGVFAYVGINNTFELKF